MKKGDKYKVKMGLEYEKQYGENFYGSYMLKGGEVVTLRDYEEGFGWAIEEHSAYFYTTEMLEPLNKNYLHEAVKNFMADNQLEINEEFRIKGSTANTYRLNEEHELKYKKNNGGTFFYDSDRLPLLLGGELEIIKAPWRPTGEYFYNSPTGIYSAYMENCSTQNLFNMQHSNYHKTYAEAEADRPRMLKIFKEIQDEFNKI